MTPPRDHWIKHRTESLADANWRAYMRSDGFVFVCHGVVAESDAPERLSPPMTRDECWQVAWAWIEEVKAFSRLIGGIEI